MTDTTPATRNRSTRDRAIRRHYRILVARIVDAETAALERRDLDLVDLLSDVVTYVTDNEWHRAPEWLAAQEAMGHHVDRLERMYAALARAEG